MRRLFIWTIFLIALVAGLYTQRVAVMDWVREASAPALPEAVAYEEIEKAEEADEMEEVAPGFPARHSSQSDGGSLGESVEADEDESSDLLVPSVPSDLLVLPVEEAPADEPIQEESTLPISINLAVPFTSQAPQGDWGEPYQEACEEASVYMVHAYFSEVEEGLIFADTADRDLLQIVEFEMGLFGFYKDTTALQTGMFAELLYSHPYEVIVDPGVQDIKRLLAQGLPVIVPAAGRLLGNPFFTAPGPLYHMLVIRGYTADGQFIVNDPGTSRGEAYLYDVDTLMNAMHDWNDGGEITEGGKVALVLTP